MRLQFIGLKLVLKCVLGRVPLSYDLCQRSQKNKSIEEQEEQKSLIFINTLTYRVCLFHFYFIACGLWIQMNTELRLTTQLVFYGVCNRQG